MRLVFCGTPEFAVPTLEALIARGDEIALVVTQPDRPSGRGLELKASPVKQSAQRHGLAIGQPGKIKKNESFRALLESMVPEAIIVVGYGRLIPAWMLSLPRFGNINLHASLLPKYRGAAPIQWAIAEGETVTGVTTMQLNEGLDTGDILMQGQLQIAPDETAPGLSARLAAIGAELMVATLNLFESGTIVRQRQDDRHASLAPILKKEDGIANFEFPASRIYNRLRGFQPWPGCYTTFRGKKLAITAAQPQNGGVQSPAVTGERACAAQEAPGTLTLAGDRLHVACGEGSALELLEVQPEGKKRISAADFNRGYRPHAGEKFGT
jgi:methionyl-tRNA formyltransferase